MHAVPQTAEETRIVKAFATTTVDTSIEQCASYELLQTSRKGLKAHYDGGGKEIRVSKVSQHSNIFLLARDLGVKGLAVREWIAKITWKRVDKDTIVITYEDCNGDASVGITPNKEYVRGSSSTYMRLTRKEELFGGVPQTEVQYVTTIGFRGLIPIWIIRLGTIAFLSTLSGMRKKFDKSEEVDAARHEQLMEMIKNHAAEYSREEDIVIDTGIETLSSLNDSKSIVKAEKVKGATQEFKNSIVFKKNDAIGWGKSVAKIRGTKEMVSAVQCMLGGLREMVVTGMWL